MLVVINGVVHVVQPAASPRLIIETRDALLGLSNWSQIWRAPQTAILAHLWSLSIEVQFYLIWPVVIVLLKGRHVGSVSLAVAAVSWAIRAHLVMSHVPLVTVYVLTYARLDGLFIGAALAAWRPSGAAPLTQGGARYPALTTGLQAAAVAVLVACVAAYPSYDPLTYLVSLPLVATCTTVLIAACAAPRQTRITQALSGAGIVALGQISYGVYLWHWPLKMLLPDTVPGGSGIIVVGGVILGALSYRWIEEPLMTGRGVQARRGKSTVCGDTSVR